MTRITMPVNLVFLRAAGVILAFFQTEESREMSE